MVTKRAWDHTNDERQPPCANRARSMHGPSGGRTGATIAGFNLLCRFKQTGSKFVSSSCPGRFPPLADARGAPPQREPTKYLDALVHGYLVT